MLHKLLHLWLFERVYSISQLAQPKPEGIELHLLVEFRLLPSTTFAYSSSDDTLTTVLTNAVDYAQSGPARALCVLAIAGAGYLWIGKGAMPKSYAIAIMCGAGFIFGAGFIGSKVLGLS